MLYDFFYVTLLKKQGLRQKSEGWLPVTGSMDKRLTRKGYTQNFGGDVFFISIVIVVTQLYTFVKAHQELLLYVNFNSTNLIF